MRSILAYFASDQAAEQAAQELALLGLKDSTVDRFSRYPSRAAQGLQDIERPFPLTHTGLEGRMDRTLAAADPGYSGMAGAELTAGAGFVLVVPEVPAEKIEKAVGIIKKHGGRV